MTTPAHPGRNLFLNLPVRDVAASKAFFTKLGFTFNPKFEDEHSTCMLIGEQVVPTVKRLVAGEPVTAAWFRSECVPKITGAPPKADGTAEPPVTLAARGKESGQ